MVNILWLLTKFVFASLNFKGLCKYVHIAVVRAEFKHTLSSGIICFFEFGIELDGKFIKFRP